MDAQTKLLLATLMEEIEKQNSKQTQTITENLNKTLEEHLSPLRQENEALRSELEILRSKVKYLDLKSRKNNVVLHGIVETETNQQELMDLVLKFLNSISPAKSTLKENQEWDRWEINNAYRIGKRLENKIRPIKVSCTLAWRRNELLKNKKKLPENVYISEDFTKEELEERRALGPKIKEARSSGKYAINPFEEMKIRTNSETEESSKN
ncbi:hypothetical protein O0L34_g11817 [Tuta absoluta]|nr:hypothetical protein O0L34_g11817 [Tuta absoluta]